MKYDSKKECIKELTAMILKEGLRVFIAERGTYGFYTNATGDRIVSFDIDLTILFHGQYKSHDNGDGWRICEGIPDNFAALLRTPSPFSMIKYTTLDEYLAVYQTSSKFKEIT